METAISTILALVPSMDNLIKLLDVVAWPFVVLVLVLIMRKPIKGLIPLIENIKYKDLDIKFRKELDKIEESVRESGVEVKHEIDKTSQIYKLAVVSPESVILQSWKELENAARDKVKQFAPKEETFRNLLNRPVSYLEYTGALPPSTAQAVRELQTLRNQAAHSVDFKVSQKSAINYALLSKTILKQIEAITELPRYKVSALTLLILELNHLIDSGKYNHISIDEIYEVIEQKRIIPYLTEKTKGNADFSCYRDDGPYSNFVEHYHEQMNNLYHGYAGDERRKWGVENLGLCLLLAWTNQLIQQGSGWHPSDF